MIQAVLQQLRLGQVVSCCSSQEIKVYLFSLLLQLVHYFVRIITVSTTIMAVFLNFNTIKGFSCKHHLGQKIGATAEDLLGHWKLKECDLITVPL